ncbi:MAG: hypothetical protein U0838_02035 [Chloroflexota bacterium]
MKAVVAAIAIAGIIVAIGLAVVFLGPTSARCLADPTTGEMLCS